MTRNKALESEIETYFKEQIKAIGGLAYKFKSTVNGVPDQIVIFDCETYFVELKRPGETIRKNQEAVHRDINKQGVAVYILDTIIAVNHFLRHVLNEEPVDLKQQTDKKSVTIRKLL